MRKTLAVIIAAMMLMPAIMAQPMIVSAANINYRVQIYATDGEGLSLKEEPDLDANKYGVIPEGETITIDSISDGWGRTNYYDKTGWVYLEYTRVLDSYISEYPTSGICDTKYYKVINTDGEGLELRTAPTSKCSTFGAIPDGTIVAVQAIRGDWAYTYYKGNFGWAHMDFMTQFTGTVAYRVTVYDTGAEGLALKKEANANSDRYLMIPENTKIAIDAVTDDGWGRTSYNGYTGWVSLRYTKIAGDYCSEIPSNGFMDAAYYTIRNTEGEGLELRCKPTVESSTYGPIYDGTSVLVQAIQGDWAYLAFNGHYGWCNTMYLR